MHPGDCFRLPQAVIALEKRRSWHRAVVVPEGAVLRIVGFLSNGHLIEAEFGDTRIHVLATDLQEDAVPL